MAGVIDYWAKQGDTVKELGGRIPHVSLGDSSLARIMIELVTLLRNVGRDEKRWKLTANGVFTVKSFYNFLNDGGLRCGWTPTILKGSCPAKINLFNWLARDNKILTLENLAMRRCNQLHSITCVMCHADIESVDHLLIHCPVASHLWLFFGQLLGGCRAPQSLKDLWGDWRKHLKKPLIPFWDWLTRAIIWNIWLERNNRIFSAICLSTIAIISKIVHMIQLWFVAAPDSKKARLEEPMAKVNRSLEFHSSRDPGPCVPPENAPLLARCSRDCGVFFLRGSCP